MTTSHTPGPWTQAAHSPTDVVADERMMVAMARDGLNGITRGQAVANARLIAAAPALLEALQHMVDMYQRYFDVMLVAWQTADDIARAAIAQATGDAV